MNALGFHGLSFKEFCRRVWKNSLDTDATGMAAQLAYYFLFSLFPLLFCLVPVISRLRPIQNALEELSSKLTVIMPEQGGAIIAENIDNLLAESQRPLVSFLGLGLIVTLWSASRAINALRYGLNLTFEAKETRPYWRLQILALWVTFAVAFLLIIGFVIFLFGAQFSVKLSKLLGLSFRWIVWVRWPFSIFVIGSAILLCYSVLPNVKHHLRALFLGTGVASVLWVVSAWGFTKYIKNFGHYNAVYGSIGSVIVLMMWFYISGLVLVVGGNINGVLLRHAQEKSDATKVDKEVLLSKV